MKSLAPPVHNEKTDKKFIEYSLVTDVRGLLKNTPTYWRQNDQ